MELLDRLSSSVVGTESKVEKGKIRGRLLMLIKSVFQYMSYSLFAYDIRLADSVPLAQACVTSVSTVKVPLP